MKFTKGPISDVVLIEPEVFGDARGFSWRPGRKEIQGAMMRSSGQSQCFEPVDPAWPSPTGAHPG